MRLDRMGFPAGYLFLFLVAGCATMNTMRSASPLAGQAVYVDAPYSTVYSAAMQCSGELGLTIAEANEATRIIYASHGMSFTSFGERVRILFDTTEADRVGMRVLSKPLWATSFFAPDWGERLVQCTMWKVQGQGITQ